MHDLRATYRLQLGPELTFAHVKELVPYLRELGVSHLYLSPSLKARSGSTHGYDQVDPRAVSEDLGGEEGLRDLASQGLGIVLDIVPNHMGTGDENPWWPDPDVFDIDPETGFHRRFFDVDDLGAVRMERPEVFDLVHAKALELVADGVLDGLRVDHPDGLADPAGYLQRLRDAGAGHVWVEKILHPGEPLRDWACDGTVGYEFLNDVQGLFVDPAAEAPLTELYAELTGERRSFDEVALEAQLEQARGTFQREIDWLERLGPDDVSDAELADALARLPVYRTYVESWSGRVDELDRRYLESVPEPLRRVLLLEEGRGRFDEFVTRFQQTSPPVTAKGIEDTAFYRYNRLLALNEVGGDPGRFGVSIEDFHAANLERAERFPNNLLITTTHDTKRTADVRARIGALSEMPDEWAAFAREVLTRWEPPDANDGYLVLQTLIGVHPIEPLERLDGYFEKALREGKRRSNWIDPDEDHERAVQQYARALLANPEFRALFDALCERVTEAGRRSALGQLLLKLTVPGIPDVYGGDELEFRALVDPDNRRPVDWESRRRALREGGDAKFELIRKVLELRARRPEVFAGDYGPVEAGEGVVAFTRGDGVVWVAVAVRPDAEVPSPDAGWRDVVAEPGLLLRERAG